MSNSTASCIANSLQKLDTAQVSRPYLVNLVGNSKSFENALYGTKFSFFKLPRARLSGQAGSAAHSPASARADHRRPCQGPALYRLGNGLLSGRLVPERQATGAPGNDPERAPGQRSSGGAVGSSPGEKPTIHREQLGARLPVRAHSFLQRRSHVQLSEIKIHHKGTKDTKIGQ